jgi:uncharacterized protein YndB with AHSA1/START domain
MTDQSFTSSFTVDRPAREVFDAINDVRSWWNEDLTGESDRVGAEFVHEVEGIHRAKIQVTELVPGRTVVWRVLENWMSFIDDQREWVGTEIRFDLTDTDGGTEIRFTHVGLVPAYECFDICDVAWSFYIQQSLRSHIATGAGQPNASPGERNYREEAAAVSPA